MRASSLGRATIAGSAVVLACSSGGSGGGVLDGGLGGTAGNGGAAGASVGGSAGQGGTAAGGASGGSGGVAGQAGAGCRADGQICAAFSECCSAVCNQGRCGGVACVDNGGPCAVFGDCCQGACDQGVCAVGYPPGPYGINEGQVLADAELDGFADAQITQLTKLRFSQFYNPADLPQGPQLLVVSLMAMWSPPDQMQEQQGDFVYWKSKRVVFLSVFGQGPTAGVPATEQDLANWAAKYALFHPLALDPNFGVLNDLFVAAGQAIPYNVFVDTRSMKIVDLHLGTQVFDQNNAILLTHVGN